MLHDRGGFGFLYTGAVKTYAVWSAPNGLFNNRPYLLGELDILFPCEIYFEKNESRMYIHHSSRAPHMGLHSRACTAAAEQQQSSSRGGRVYRRGSLLNCTAARAPCVLNFDSTTGIRGMGQRFTHRSGRVCIVTKTSVKPLPHHFAPCVNLYTYICVEEIRTTLHHGTHTLGGVVQVVHLCLRPPW